MRGVNRFMTTWELYASTIGYTMFRAQYGSITETLTPRIVYREETYEAYFRNIVNCPFHSKHISHYGIHASRELFITLIVVAGCLVWGKLSIGISSHSKNTLLLLLYCLLMICQFCCYCIDMICNIMQYYPFYFCHTCYPVWFITPIVPG